MPSSALTTSDQVRERLQKAGVRFFANDNISPFIKESEIAELQKEVESHLQNMLRALVIDVDNDHNSRGTAERLARMYMQEIFRGRYQPPPVVTQFPNAEKLEELMIVGPIAIRSVCSHHLCPVLGKVWLGIIPNASTNVIGLSKYARLADWIMARPQIQEEAIVQLADLIAAKMSPQGIAIMMKATHFCMNWRGIKDSDARMINSVMRGRFADDANLRREFFSLINDHSSEVNQP